MGHNVIEQWKALPDWDGYEASDQGRIRSINRVVKRQRSGRTETMFIQGKLRKETLTKDGYLCVSLSRPGQSGTFKIHQLVLEAFVGPAGPGEICRHLDDVRTNNALVNLKWGTPGENNQDCIANGNHHNANKTMCPQGHAYKESNGRRYCPVCRAAALRRWRSVHGSIRRPGLDPNQRSLF